ncbi:MAG: sodium:solute symporter family protein, partial [Candidatus Cardinium sp.]|nr:sodium:solute symporter family protein [Candidatus Cardinium sp.]
MLFNLPFFMVMVFLIVTLIVGFYYSHKTTTLREYAVGNKQFATSTLVATMLATRFGGEMIRDIEQIHNNGLYWMLLMLSSSLPFLLLSRLVLRMGPFMHHLSMPETIGSIYGTYPRIIAALSSICNSIASIAAQIIVMSKVFGICGFRDPRYITIAATIVLMAYSAFGGIKAVVFTDMLQFITFSIVIPLLAWLMFTQIDKPIAALISFLQDQEKFQFKFVYQFDMKLLSIFSIVLAFLMVYIEHSSMQRIYMSSGPIQAQRVCLYVSIFNILITTCIICIGLFVFIKEPMIPLEEIWPNIISRIPLLFRGFICISLLAMAMSTADSDLNTCSVIVSNDLLTIIRSITHLSHIHPLRLARYTSIVIGFFSMLLAFQCNNLLELLYLIFDFFVPVITAPFILATFGFRSTTRTALIGMAVGILSILTWNKWIQPMEPTIGINGAFPCMLANGLAMLLAHYLLPQPAGTGWLPPDKTYQQWQQEKERIRRRNEKERATFFTKENLEKLKPNTLTLVAIGIYLVIVSLVSSCYYNAQPKELWACFPFCMLGATYIGYEVFFANKIPSWRTGKYWFVSVLCGLLSHLLLSCYLTHELLLPFILFFTHGSVLLWTLPLYWSIRGIFVSMGIMMAIYCCKTTILWPASTELLPVLIAGLCLLIGIVYFKYQNRMQQERVAYFLQQNEYKEAYELKKLAYSEELPTASPKNALAQEGSILEKAIQNVTQSIAFVDSTTPFLKEDFQSILDKFAEWAFYLKQRAKRQDQLL